MYIFLTQDSILKIKSTDYTTQYMYESSTLREEKNMIDDFVLSIGVVRIKSILIPFIKSSFV